MFYNGRDPQRHKVWWDVMFYNGRDLRDTRFGGM